MMLVLLQGGWHWREDTYSTHGLHFERGKASWTVCLEYAVKRFFPFSCVHSSLVIDSQMKFVESILSNNTTDDHCQEFVNQKGLLPLVSILGLPNLPIDFPTSAACQAVAGVCKSILVRIYIFTDFPFYGSTVQSESVWRAFADNFPPLNPVH